MRPSRLSAGQLKHCRTSWTESASMLAFTKQDTLHKPVTHHAHEGREGRRRRRRGRGYLEMAGDRVEQY